MFLLILLDLADILTLAPSKFLNVKICLEQSLNFSEAPENHRINAVFHHEGMMGIDYCLFCLYEDNFSQVYPISVILHMVINESIMDTMSKFLLLLPIYMLLRNGCHISLIVIAMLAEGST
jgi:hypothetical protein